jgi:hypothetical protein
MTFGSSWTSNGSQRAAQRCDLELLSAAGRVQRLAQCASAYMAVSGEEQPRAFSEG